MGRRWAEGGLVACLLVAVVFVLRHDMRVTVTYRPVLVVGVQVVARSGTFDRLVIVDLGDTKRGIWTSDPYIATPVGGRVCLEENRLLLRRWTRYALQMPQYCPFLRRGSDRTVGLTAP